MGADLGSGVSGLQWVVDAYTLVLAALLLTAVLPWCARTSHRPVGGAGGVAAAVGPVLGGLLVSTSIGGPCSG
jgi:hypothetical protein